MELTLRAGMHVLERVGIAKYYNLLYTREDPRSLLKELMRLPRIDLHENSWGMIPTLLVLC